jgi:hypothetical protein
MEHTAAPARSDRDVISRDVISQETSFNMSDAPSSNKFLYLIVGALAAAVIGFGVYYFTEGDGGSDGVEISVGENGIKVDEN